MDQALAAHNNGGIVIAQVKRITKDGSLRPHDVRVPGMNNRVLRFTQAKVIGGGSTINAQLYTRGNAADYDLWESEDGCTGWDYRSVLPYFKRAEDN